MHNADIKSLQLVQYDKFYFSLYILSPSPCPVLLFVMIFFYLPIIFENC